jgi:3-phosphoshikimate 1-carboxyvinyltransferase
MGAGHRVEVKRFAPPAFALKIPGDVSSAAFLIAAAVACGEVRIENVGLNQLRTGFLQALAQMGADVSSDIAEDRMNEPVGTIGATRSDLRALTIEPEVVPTLHDELPLLAVLATQAAGETIVRGAEELRVKEADRIVAMTQGLRRLGADVDELPDGFVVRGPVVLSGATVDAAGDHRIAMALAVAGLVAKGDTRIEGFESADISWPGFERALAAVGADVELL